MPRNPNVTARNKRIDALKIIRRRLQPRVFRELRDFDGGRLCTEAQLNAFIGSKAADYLDLSNGVIKTPMEYQSNWLAGLKREYVRSQRHGGDPRHAVVQNFVTGDYPFFKRYLGYFLESSFLKHYEEHYRIKPPNDESEYWFGNNNDEFGLLITPRFRGGKWENDQSEIRHFKFPYWTLSHVMETGLCYLGEDRIRNFTTLKDYLEFFHDCVRRTKSKYQLDIADRYIAHVESHVEPLSLPMLIPELRYEPALVKHEHRLDFLLINPGSLEKFGFEISPWSSHGRLKGRDKTLAEHNVTAKKSFEDEMRKQKRYWRKYGVTYVVYTDQDLADMDSIWDEISGHLEVDDDNDQLELALLYELA